MDGQQTGMVYDADGERLIRRDPDGSATLYLGAMELRLASGQVTAKRYYSTADDGLVAMRDTGGVTWVLAGMHGSTQLAVNDATGTVSRERYLPFGQRRGGDDLPFTDRGFLGKTEDASTGLTYLGARYYDPAIAKFISTDPELDLRTPEWANPYSYAANNPIDQSDPDGRRVDAGGGSSDKSYGYSRNKNRPNANQNFAQTHNPNGSKKTARERKIYKQRHQQYEKQRRQRAKETAAWKKREAERSRYYTRESHIRKEETEAWRYLSSALGVGMSDKGFSSAMSARYPIGFGKRPVMSISRAKNPVKSGSCSSFVPGTKVLMADGTAKPIENIQVGENVLATDPATGKTAGKTVTGLMTSSGKKTLVQITVSAGGSEQEHPSIVTTDNHPFYVAASDSWIEAKDLRSGMWLRTAAGTYVQIEAVRKWSANHRVHNLSVNETHTYYVVADGISALAHNAPCRTFGRMSPNGRLDVPDTQGIYIIKMNDGKVYVGSATKNNTIHRRVHRAFSQQDHAVASRGYTRDDVRELDWIEMPDDSDDVIHQYEQGVINRYGGIGGGTLLNKINAPRP
ncbi:polymorphic toxin-type HINT domain-containing protein [Nonomuraea sp. NPDC051941]|uniref:polymorphic toxin-type HINT domain-containing protein n=1 Tax=Nonomuraea sp. NPDC051941 TaxID=3364373 RepID=UPI0037CBC764